MAERRMFTKTIIDSDAFLEMSASAQALYFHLGMRADDDGFVNNPHKIQRMVGAADDDLKILIAKRFVIAFESGVLVIKHWRMHNYIRGDRYKETVYQDEMKQLLMKDNGSYSLVNQMTTKCLPSADKVATQVRLGKDSIGKDRIGEDKSTVPAKPSHAPAKFIPPTVEEVKAYCLERKSVVDPEAFVAYYETRGWKLKTGEMKNWRTAVITWERNGYGRQAGSVVGRADRGDDDGEFPLSKYGGLVL